MPSKSFAETFVSSTIGVDLRRSALEHPRPAALCNDLFLIAVKMREAQDLGDPASLRKLILHYLTLLSDNCRIAGLETAIVEEIRFAIVALLDETVLSVPGACRDYWLAQPLQLELYGEALAGEAFYRRLERLLAAGKSSRDALEVCYYCLCLGFEGKYRLGGEEVRATLIQQVAHALQGSQGVSDTALWVHGDTGGSRSVRRAGILTMAWYAPALVSAIVVVAVWATVTLLNGFQDARVAAAIRALLGK